MLLLLLLLLLSQRETRQEQRRALYLPLAVAMGIECPPSDRLHREKTRVERENDSESMKLGGGGQGGKADPEKVHLTREEISNRPCFLLLLVLSYTCARPPPPSQRWRPLDSFSSFKKVFFKIKNLTFFFSLFLEEDGTG